MGRGSPCCVWYPELKLSCVVHGDDFTCLGTDASLDVYEQMMKKHFDVKLKGRIGFEDKGEKQMRVLNRIIHVTEQGLSYEADPRHAELLARDLGLEIGSKILIVPGQKPEYDPEKHKNEHTMHDNEEIDRIENIMALVNHAKKTCLRVHFDEHITRRDYAP